MLKNLGKQIGDYRWCRRTIAGAAGPVVGRCCRRADLLRGSLMQMRRDGWKRKAARRWFSSWGRMNLQPSGVEDDVVQI
ncbi:hypothetical protein ACLOJK_019645 [Asimina triloba]